MNIHDQNGIKTQIYRCQHSSTFNSTDISKPNHQLSTRYESKIEIQTAVYVDISINQLSSSSGSASSLSENSSPLKSSENSRSLSLSFSPNSSVSSISGSRFPLTSILSPPSKLEFKSLDSSGRSLEQTPPSNPDADCLGSIGRRRFWMVCAEGADEAGLRGIRNRSANLASLRINLEAIAGV